MADLLVERPRDGVALVRINRPEARNALNGRVRMLLADAFTELGRDDGVRAIVLTGDKDVFAAGADIREMADAGAVEIMLRQTHLLWAAIASCPKPVIAAVNGFALGGGCELAMHADIIVAGEGARFGQPEIRVGIMPGAGGTQRLTRAIGKYKAMLLLLTGEPVGAREADAMGLVSTVVPDAEAPGHRPWAGGDDRRHPPLAARQIKEVVLAGMDASLETALMLERKAFQLLFDTRDQKEGMRAFLEKRRPTYEGK